MHIGAGFLRGTKNPEKEVTVMAFTDSMKSVWKKVAGGVKTAASAVKNGWKKGWDFLEDKSVRFEEVYELRDFKNTSGIGIWCAILSIVFGIFYMSINLVSGRLSIGGSFISDVGQFFTFLSLILLIMGTLTTTNAGLIFICTGMTLPVVGEIVRIFFMLFTGRFVTYMSTKWIFLVTFAAIAAVYVLTFFRKISVKLGRYILLGCSVLFLVFAILSVALHFPPFYGTEMALLKGQSEMTECGFVYVTDAAEYIFYVIAVACIHLTVFDRSAEGEEHVVTKVVEKEEKEEF